MGRAVRFLVAASVATALLVATLLLPLAGPAADDFCRATVSDFPAHFVTSYTGHTGRWASVGFLSPVLLTSIDLFSPWQGGGVLLGLLAAFLTLFYSLIRVVLAPSTPRRLCLVAAALLTAIWWAGLPSPGQTVYWISSGVEYGLGFVLSAALCLAVVWHGSWHSSDRPSPAITAGLACCAFIVTGIHEVIALTVVIVLCVIVGVLIKERSPSRGAISSVLVIAIIGLAVSALAPGNTVRAERVSQGWSPGEVVYAFYLDWYTLVVPWITDAKLLTASLLLVTSGRFSRLAARNEDAIRNYWWLFPATTALLIAACLAPTALILGGTGPGRLHNLAYSIFIVGWFLTLFAFGRRMAGAAIPNLARWRGTVALLFAFSLLFTGNMQLAVGALIGRNDATSWHSWLQTVAARGTEASEAGRKSLTLSQVQLPPVIYGAGFSRIPDKDSTHFINRCMAEYLGVPEVIVIEPIDAAR